MITHVEPDILECEVKWGVENISQNKASSGNAIPAELFQILKDAAVKILHSKWQQIWKTQQGPQDWKRLVSIPISKKCNAKECSNSHTIAFIAHASNAMLKILHARLQQYMNQELPDVQMDLEKGEEPEIIFPTPVDHRKRKGKTRKTSTSALLTTLKPLTVWNTTNCGNTRPPNLPPEKPVCRSRSNS